LTATQSAYIGLGANLGDREATLREAVGRLEALGEVTAVSSLYETEPVGFRDQPPFLNAVVRLQTARSPGDLMQGLLAIEQAMGRVRTFRNAPRTLDLDLLLFGDKHIATAKLTLPHPHLHERAFVLVPLAEIGPTAVHPTFQRTIRELLETLVSDSGVRRIAAAGWQIIPPNDARMFPGH